MSLDLVLYSKATSSCAYRARIALNLKKLAYKLHTVETAHNSLSSNEYVTLNPQSLIPLLVHQSNGDVLRLSQSIAIMEFIDETFPEQGVHLLPADPAGRARVRSIALHIACDMQPLNNTRVVEFIKEGLGGTSDTQKDWSLHWAEIGLRALEAEFASTATGSFCHGNTPTMADCCLVPQVFRATLPSVGADLSKFPRVQQIYDNCLQLEEFRQARPENQPDAKN